MKKVLEILFLVALILLAIFFLKNINTPPVVTPPTPATDSHANLIKINVPTKNATVVSPLTVSGEARGMWYFEASFPIKIYDANKNLLGTTVAQAQGEWMTENFVPFLGTLDFATSTTQTGTIVFQKDNPSGLPEHDDSIEIPVQFATTTTQATRDILLYYYNPNLDKDTQGNILCSTKGLAAVTRTIPRTLTPLQDTLNLLISGVVSPIEKASGITTEYPLANFTIKSASIKNKVLTVYFNDPENKTSGGSCRVSILRSQIEKTALQFPEITEVRILPEELFQP